MAMSVNAARLRGRFGELLQASNWLIAGELIVLFALCFARVFPFSVQLLLLAFASLSLWLRGLSWRDVGLSSSKSWWKIAVRAVLAAVLISLIANVLVQPFVDRLISRPLNDPRFANLPGNVKVLLGWLAAVWTIVAFGEEMIFRGYLMNRITDLAGKTRTGWALALLGSSVIFGLAHGYQGLAGVVSTAEVGVLLGLLFLFSKRNLWANIVCHGAFDSISLIALYYSRSA
jgi:membrane protease YdiL (CAAX protease family)